MKLLVTRTRLHSRQRGQAYTEFLAISIALVPLFLAIPLVGKYLDVKQKSIEASRYAVWERAVWSDTAASWNNGPDEKSKTDEEIAAEIDARLFGHPLRPMSAATGSDPSNPLWQTHKREAFLQAAGTRAETVVTEDESPANILLVDQVAHDGVPFLGSALNAVSDAIAFLGEPIGCDGIGVDFSNGLDLGARNFARAEVSMPLRIYLGLGEEPTDIDMTSTAALLTNAWAGPSESVFRERVDRLVFDEAVGCITVPAQAIGLASFGPNTAIFGEALNAHPVKEAVDSTVLLPDYIEQ